MIPSCRLFCDLASQWRHDFWWNEASKSLGAFICFPQWHVSPKELFPTLTSIVETSRFLIPFPNIWSKSMMVTLEAPGADRGSGRFGKAEALRGWIATRQGMDSSLKARGFFFARPMVVICDDLVRGFISWAVGVALYLSCWSHNPIIVWGQVDSCSMGTGWEGGFVDGFGECSRFQGGCRSLVARMSHEVCFNNSYIDHGPWWCVS